MRKFQYLVTMDLDDGFFLSDEEMVASIKKLDGIDGPDIISGLASARFPEAITDTLSKNMGDCGNTNITTSFVGELKESGESNA